MRNFSLALVTCALACSEPTTTRMRLVPASPPVAPADPVVALRVSPVSMIAFVGLPTAFAVAGITRASDTVAVLGARWTLDNPTVATVDSVTGTLTTLAAGTTHITVRWQQLVASAELVTRVQCRGPELSVQGPSVVAVGERVQWKATISACADTVGTHLQFSVDDSTRLRVIASGEGVGVASGRVTLTARLVPNGNTASTLLVDVVP